MELYNLKVRKLSQFASNFATEIQISQTISTYSPLGNGMYERDISLRNVVDTFHRDGQAIGLDDETETRNKSSCEIDPKREFEMLRVAWSVSLRSGLSRETRGISKKAVCLTQKQLNESAKSELIVDRKIVSTDVVISNDSILKSFGVYNARSQSVRI